MAECIDSNFTVFNFETAATMLNTRNVYVACMTNNKRPEMLAQTLKSADAEGNGWVPYLHTVWCSDITTVESKSWRWRYRQAYFPDSPHVVFGEILEKAAHSGSDLVYFEDDLIFCKNALAYLWKAKVPEDAAFLSAFDWQDTEDLVKPRTAAKFSGIQCVKIPLRTVKLLLESWPMSTETDPWYDLTVGKILQNATVHYTPISLVQHVGWQSSVGNPLCVVSKRFRPEFDALTL